MSINGDDAVELFQNGGVIDVFGDINTDGTGEPWDHLDGWAYRKDGTGPDGTSFNLGNWTFSGINAFDGETSNASAATPMPIGSYSVPEPSSALLGGIALLGLIRRRR
ncbi:PEP-CTERM sorting domain-containing protein [Akkermansiaceae bacterium]|nr:PEP-CTERM sorting domain-containing protein [Akkermansiaceae bacterium]